MERKMRPCDQRGSILILSLWALMLLTAFTVSLGYGVRQKAALFERLDTLSALYPAAYSGVEAARGLMKLDDLVPLTDCFNDSWAQSISSFKEVKVGDKATFTVSYQKLNTEDKQPLTIYGMTDEQSKIGINTADAQTLTRILQLTGELDQQTAEEIAYNIIDWRDSDSVFEHPNYGAEEDYYSHLPVPYAAKNAPFEVIDELLLVKGINHPLFDKIKEFLTPFGSGVTNINTASQETLLALGLNELLVSKIMNYRKGDDKEDRTADDRFFSQSGSIAVELNRVSAIDQSEKTTLDNLISVEKLGTISSQFMVKSRGVLNKNGAYVDMEAAVDRKGKVYYLRESSVQWPSKS